MHPRDESLAEFRSWICGQSLVYADSAALLLSAASCPRWRRLQPEEVSTCPYEGPQLSRKLSQTWRRPRHENFLNSGGLQAVPATVPRTIFAHANDSVAANRFKS